MMVRLLYSHSTDRQSRPSRSLSLQPRKCRRQDGGGRQPRAPCRLPPPLLLLLAKVRLLRRFRGGQAVGLHRLVRERCPCPPRPVGRVRRACPVDAALCLVRTVHWMPPPLARSAGFRPAVRVRMCRTRRFMPTGPATNSRLFHGKNRYSPLPWSSPASNLRLCCKRRFRGTIDKA